MRFMPDGRMEESMINPGMMISDRYEIIDRVGSGGMADVYKAKCHRLNRYVAIKVLKQEYSSDAKFVAKFEGRGTIRCRIVTSEYS